MGAYRGSRYGRRSNNRRNTGDKQYDLFESFRAFVYLNTCRPAVHAAGAEERNLPEADALAQRHEDDAVVGTSHHLDR